MTTIKRKLPSKALISLFAGVFFTGISGIFVKFSDAPGTVTTFYRMFVGVLVLTPVFFIQLYNKKFIVTQKGIAIALFAGLLFGLDMALWASGIVMSNATLPTIMGNLAPLWVGLIALIFLKEQLNWKFWLGLTFATLGVFIMVHQNLTNANNILIGILLGGAAGIFYAIFYIIAQKGRKTIDTIPFLYFSTLGSALFLIIVNVLLNTPLTGYSTNNHILFMTYGLGVQAIGWMFINYAQGHFKATFVSTILLGQPLVTATIAVLLLNEILTGWHYLGASVVILGIYIVQASREKN